jgi:hypothetical protein
MRFGRRAMRICVIGVSAAVWVGFASARRCEGAIYTVDVTADSGPGSLRWAMTEANATSGLDSVVFNIPGSPPYTIRPDSILPTITDPIDIDGTSQPGWAGEPIIELDGSLTTWVTWGAGIRIESGGSSVRGLVINRFPADGVALYGGSGNTVQGNYIGTDLTGTVSLGNGHEGVGMNDSHDNLVGGTTPETRNVISGNLRSGVIMGGYGGASGNQVVGNYIGLDATGTVALGNAVDCVWIGHAAHDNTVGGDGAGAGNVVAGAGRFAVCVMQSAADNHILGNYVGTDASGTVPLGNAGSGISLLSSNNVVGGTVAGSGNLVSGNLGHGILIDGSSRNQVLINRIGTDASGTSPLGNGGDGLRIAGGSENIVGLLGGTGGSTIAFNAGAGIRVSSGGANCLLANSVHSNGGLGIDLGADGVTPNDPGDGDTGANNLQNFPVLTSVSSGGGYTNIQGELNSTPESTFSLQFFASAQSDPTGYGEGETYLGTTGVTTDAAGTALFAVSFPGEVPLGYVVAATATDAMNNTSEFGPVGLVVAVELSTFTAVSEDGSVRLAWTTLSERDNYGFHVHRSRIQAGPYVCITEQVIPGAGTSSEPHDYSYYDRDVQTGVTYFYKLADIDLWGGVTMHGPVSVAVLPAEYALGQNAPNPFATSTTVRLSLKDPGRVSLKIHNVAGELVRTLHDGVLHAGVHDIVWDGRGEDGVPAAAGSYTYTMRAGELTRSHTMILVR